MDGSGSISRVTMKCFSRFTGVTAVHLLSSNCFGFSGVGGRAVGGISGSVFMAGSVRTRRPPWCPRGGMTVAAVWAGTLRAP